MAFIGLRYPVVAKLTSHTAGSEPTYTGGMVMGHAMSADLQITRNNNPLRADDVEVEDDNGITSMQITEGVDDISEDVRVYMGLLKEKTGTGEGAVTEYYETDGAAFDVGHGYIRVRKKNNVVNFQAVWMFKVMFGEDSESSQTKGESIEWQTPTVTGKAHALDVGGAIGIAFRKKANFGTEAAAKAWLNNLAGIT